MGLFLAANVFLKNERWPSGHTFSSQNLRYVMRYSVMQVLESTVNGTWHRVRTLQKGSTELYAELSGLMDQVSYVDIV